MVQVLNGPAHSRPAFWQTSLALIFTTVVLSLFAPVNATTGMPSSYQRTITPNSEWGSLVLLYAPPRMTTLCTLQLRGASPSPPSLIGIPRPPSLTSLTRAAGYTRCQQLVQALRREHRACDERLKVANTSVMTSERAKASLRAGHEACHEQHESLTAQLKAAREQASSLAHVSALEMRRDESALYEQLTAAKNHLRVAEGKLTATEGSLAATKATLTATVEKLSAAESKLKEAEVKLEGVQSDLAASEARASAAAARASAAETTVMALEGRLSTAEAKHAAAEGKLTATEGKLEASLELLESTPPPLLLCVVGVLVGLGSALALGDMLCVRRSPHEATDAELHTVRHGQWGLGGYVGGYGRDAAATAWAVWVHAVARRMAHAHRMRSGRRFVELRRLSIAFAAWELVLGAADDDNDNNDGAANPIAQGACDLPGRGAVGGTTGTPNTPGIAHAFSTSEDAKRATGAHRGASIASEGAEGVRAWGAATKGLLLRGERAGQAVVVRAPNLATLASSERARARVWNKGVEPPSHSRAQRG